MKASEFLQSLVDQHLCYGLKSQDLDLFDFGFGQMVDIVNSCKKPQEACTHILHALCRFKVIYKDGEHRVDKYYEDTPCEEFHAAIKRLIGLKVIRIALSDKNDLWLDLGDYWLVFATNENNEESWRFFVVNQNMPHLVASNNWLCFSY